MLSKNIITSIISMSWKSVLNLVYSPVSVKLQCIKLVQPFTLKIQAQEIKEVRKLIDQRYLLEQIAFPN